MTDLNICVIGDAFVSGAGDKELLGWAGRLLQSANAEQGPINYFNLGVPGDTSLQTLKRLKEILPRFPVGHDNRLIIALGLTDTEMTEGKVRLGNQESVAALSQLLAKARSRCKLLMVSLPPVYEPQRNTRIKRLNALFQELCSKARVPFIDIYSALADDIQYRRELASLDRVLPGQAGYKKIADLIWNDRSWWFN